MQNQLIKNVRNITLVGASLAMLTACGGPTKSGIENREAARGRINSVNARIEFDQARQSFEAGQFATAMSQIDTAIQRFPEAAEFHLLRGRTLLEMQRLDEAKASMEEAVAQDSECADAEYFLGVIHERWSDDAQAATHYERAYVLAPGSAQNLLASAECLVALERLDEANALIEANMDYFEHNASMRQLQGQIAILKGDLDLAASHYKQARLLAPDDLSLLEEVAMVQFDAGRFGDAYETIRLLRVHHHIDRFDLRLMEARSLTYMDRITEARDLYVQLSNQEPANADVWIELGRICWLNGDQRRLAQCAVRAIALAPDRFEGYMYKGVNEREHGDFEEARRLFAQSCDRTDDNVMPYILLGRTNEALGLTDDARIAYNDALNMQPTNGSVRSLIDRLDGATAVTSVSTDDQFDN